MPRRTRPPETERSEHWLRVAVNEHTDALNSRVREVFGWQPDEQVEWISPIVSDDYAEYYDQEFLEKLGRHDRDLKVSLASFWPRSGPRWDGLAKTKNSGKIILVEAKAYVEEAVDYGTRAGAASHLQIDKSLAATKEAFGARMEASWQTPFYQHANRLAHLYFARELNSLDAYLLFLYFADAPDVPSPCTKEQWLGAIRLIDRCLGLGKHRFRPFVKPLIWRVPEMLSGKDH